MVPSGMQYHLIVCGLCEQTQIIDVEGFVMQLLALVQSPCCACESNFASGLSCPSGARMLEYSEHALPMCLQCELIVLSFFLPILQSWAVEEPVLAADLSTTCHMTSILSCGESVSAAPRFR